MVEFTSRSSILKKFNSIAENPLKRSSFYHLWSKKYHKIYKIRKYRTDCCGTCLELQIQLQTRNNNVAILDQLVKHQEEAEERYKKWRESRFKIGIKFNEEEKTIEHFSNIFILFY